MYNIFNELGNGHTNLFNQLAEEASAARDVFTNIPTLGIDSLSVQSAAIDEFTEMASQAQALSDSLGINEARETALSSLGIDSLSVQSATASEFTRMANQAQALNNSLSINEARETTLSSLSDLHQLAQPDSAIELAAKEAIDATTHGVRSAFDRLNHVGKSIEKTLALGDGLSAFMTEHQDQIDRLARTALDHVSQAGVPRQLLEDVFASNHLQTEINSILGSFVNLDLDHLTERVGKPAFQEPDLEFDNEIIEATTNQIIGFLLILVNFPFPENTPTYAKVAFWLTILNSLLNANDRLQDYFSDKKQIQSEVMHTEQIIQLRSFVAHSDVYIYNEKNLISKPAAKIPKGTSYEIVKYLEVSDKVNFNDEMGLPQTGYIKK